MYLGTYEGWPCFLLVISSFAAVSQQTYTVHKHWYCTRTILGCHSGYKWSTGWCDMDISNARNALWLECLASKTFPFHTRQQLLLVLLSLRTQIRPNWFNVVHAYTLFYQRFDWISKVGGHLLVWLIGHHPFTPHLGQNTRTAICGWFNAYKFMQSFENAVHFSSM